MGKKFWSNAFKDGITKENLLKHYVKNETNFPYKKGVIQSFGSMPVQMCQFHQVAIIRRSITKNPKLLASIELKELVAMLKMTDRESFEGALNDWFLKWEDFLSERTTNIETGRSYYTHKRIGARIGV